jgi:ABC-2 type transport system ATP-binding protein
MVAPLVHLDQLTKIYTIHEREAGAFAAVRSLVRRKTRDVRAVDGISFDIAPGEIVGFLGPNGAGKTTTLKMLAGLLHPTAGAVSVLGYEPFRRQRDFLRQIALVMGQRNQLVWDIPAADTYEVNRVIYDIPRGQFDETLAELTELLDLGELIRKPVRNLSLGERMKCEIAGVLLHRPKILFLDEPTIGLDVTAQRRIREFIAEYNQRHNATVLLTSHYMADVVALCERVVVIHQGHLLFDGDLADLIQRFASYKTIVIDFPHGAVVGLREYGDVVSRTAAQATLRVPKDLTAQVTSRLLADLPITDLTIQDPPIEQVIERVFASGNGV